MELFQCRLCGGSLRVVLDLGNLYISGFIEESEHAGEKEPLVLATCKQCDFAQLKHIVNPDRMYRQYWYKSSLNKSMVEALKDVVVSSVSRWAGNKKNPVALDIGANDGTMLSMYPENFTTVGFDPALNLKEEAEKRCDVFVSEYFVLTNYPSHINQADIVTAIAMFYDLNDPGHFLDDVARVMDKDGILVIQMTDMISMLKANAFDNICHEHAGYYTLVQMIKLLDDHGFHVFDVERNMVNGGSVRIYAAKNRRLYQISPTVLAEIGREAQYLQQYDDPFLAFALRVINIGLTISRLVMQTMGEGVPIYALGASTKGNTLLQYFGLDLRSVAAIGEVNEDKFDKRTVGTNILIIPEEDVLKAKPLVLMILPWHFRDFFVKKLWDLMDKHGTELLFPLPEPELVYIRGGELVVEKLLSDRGVVPWAR